MGKCCCIALCFVLLQLFSGMNCSDLTDMLATYDKDFPPYIDRVNNVTYDLGIAGLLEISELQSYFEITVKEYMVWKDPRLDYDGRINLSSYNSSIWLPVTAFANVAAQDFETRQLYLYPGGELHYSVTRFIRVTCILEFELLPFDRHECSLISFVLNEPLTYVALVPPEERLHTNYESESYFKSRFVSEDIKYKIEVSEGFVSNQFQMTTNMEHGGVEFVVEITRKPGFIMYTYFIPSLVIIVCCYCSFFINKEGVPARASLPALCVLATITILSSVTVDIPSLSYNPWLIDYLTGVYCFLSVSAIEYAMVSCCSVMYNQRRELINKQIQKLSSYLEKKKKKDEKVLLRNYDADSIDLLTSSSEEEPPDEGNYEFDAKFQDEVRDMRRTSKIPLLEDVQTPISAVKLAKKEEEEKQQNNISGSSDPFDSSFCDNEKYVERRGASTFAPKQDESKPNSDDIYSVSQIASSPNNLPHFEQNTREKSTIDADRIQVQFKNSEKRDEIFSLNDGAQSGDLGQQLQLKKPSVSALPHVETKISEPIFTDNSRVDYITTDAGVNMNTSRNFDLPGPNLNTSDNYESSKPSSLMMPRLQRKKDLLKDSGESQAHRIKFWDLPGQLTVQAEHPNESRPIESLIKKASVKASKSGDPEGYRDLIKTLKHLASESKFMSKKESTAVAPVVMDRKMKMRVQKILKIENQILFHFCNFVNSWLDYYARRAYPLMFICYIVYMMIRLTNNDGLILAVVIIEAVIVSAIVICVSAKWILIIRKRVRAAKRRKHKTKTE